MTGVGWIRRRLNESLLARALASNFLLGGISVIVVTVLVLALQLAAFQRQLHLQAKSLAEFVASQSEFAMLVGDRTELERIARQALSVEDVLFVVLADARADTPIQVSRADYPKIHIPRTTAKDSPDESTVQLESARLLEVVLPVLAPSESGLVEWKTRQAKRARLGVVRMGVSMEKQTRLFQRTVR
ncbi:MAG: hypothetical protein HY238_16440, partial [Acidobacteria bacterium]|nr:hypothetical protein [Acidobacteriota bacterium]